MNISQSLIVHYVNKPMFKNDVDFSVQTEFSVLIIIYSYIYGNMIVALLLIKKFWFPSWVLVNASIFYFAILPD